jgi:hypothetical protein
VLECTCSVLLNFLLNNPENRLALMEALLKWNEAKTFRNELARFPPIWTEARKEFSGSEWKDEWLDWEKRWSRLQAEAKSK